MKNNITLLLIALNISVNVSGQAPAILWQNTIGGNGDDLLRSIEQTADGGYILSGYSTSNISGDKNENSIGSSDYWLVKTDATGNIQWQNTIGGTGAEALFSAQQTADGGYILAGYSNSNISGDKTENSNGNFDYWLVKTDGAGNIQWQNTIGGTGAETIYSVQQTTDGGYILGGNSLSNISGDKTENNIGLGDYWIVKIDPTGNIQWQNTIGGTGADDLRFILQTADGGYILGGSSRSGISGDKTENNVDTSLATTDYWVVKTDASGNIQWQNTIGGNATDYLYSILQTTDGGYILGGFSDSNISGDKTENSNGLSDHWLVKTDAAGNIQWQNTIGGSDNDWLYSMEQTADGGYILGGFSNSNISGDKTENNIDTIPPFSSDYWIIKTDAAGNIQWQKNIGGNDWDELFAIHQTTDGGYIFGGWSDSNISGDKTENCNGGHDYWIVKLAHDFPTAITNNNSLLTETILLYPNPATNEIRIQSSGLKVVGIEIYNVLGERVFSQLTNNNQQTINVAALAPGIYFVKVKSEKQERVSKFVKQ